MHLYCIGQTSMLARSQKKLVHDPLKETIKVIPITSDKILNALPARVDNSTLKYFPDILNQSPLPTCQQFSGVYYTFSYEMNRLRDLTANTPVSVFPPTYTFNFMNTTGVYGVSYYYTFDVLKTQGHPDMEHYGVLQDLSGLYWMSGYENYYNATQNRLKEVYRIPVNTQQGLLMLKNWLHNHLNGEATGGVAFFGCSNIGTEIIPYGHHEAGKTLLLHWGPEAVHGLTVVGYDDEVEYDVNNDGIISNTIDINNDGIVDLRDYEKGAFKLANSYGDEWADEGFFYALYSSFAHNYTEGGVWNESVYVLEPYSEFKPALTLKANITHNNREKLQLKAGISADTSKLTPEHTLDFLIFNYQGGPLPMKGTDTLPDPENLELGLDISPLLSYVQSGEPAKFFLIIHENDPDGSGSGKVNSFSVFNHAQSTIEYKSHITNAKIIDNAATYLPVLIRPFFDGPQITRRSINFNGEVPQTHQLEAHGGTPSFTWSIPAKYLVNENQTALPPDNGLLIEPQNPEIPQNLFKLPFSFSFCGKDYDTLYINHTGFVAFEPSQMPYQYTTDGENVLASIPCIGAGHHERITAANIHQCWLNVNDSICEIRWKYEFTYNGVKSLINTGIRLRKGGSFDIVFGSLPDVPSFPLAWGYSDGTGSKEFLSTIYKLADMSDKSFTYLPHMVTDKLTITPQGLLNLTVPPGYIQEDFTVRVTDKNLISAAQKFVLHNGVEIIDQSGTGNNNYIEFNETCKVSCMIRNYTDQFIYDPILSISFPDHNAVITDTLYRPGNIPPGDSVILNDVFTFTLKDKPGRAYSFIYHLLLKSGNVNTVKMCIVPAASALIHTSGLVVSDGHDYALQPGEASLLELSVVNKGAVSTQGFNYSFSADDPSIEFLQINDPGISEILPDQRADFRIFVKAGKDIPENTECKILVHLNDQHGLDTVMQYPLKIGKRPIYIVDLAAGSHTSDSLKQYFDKKNVKYTIVKSLPDNQELLGIPAVFLTTGFGGSPYINSIQSDVLIGYLNNGGNLYFESLANTWLAQIRMPVCDQLGAELSQVSTYILDPLVPDQNIFSGPFIDYTSSSKASKVTAEIGDNSISFLSPASNENTIVQWGAKTGVGAAIGSMVAFGLLKDRAGATIKDELVDEYLKWFDIKPATLNPLFHIFNNQICTNGTISFFDDSYDNLIYRKWTFEGGTPATSYETEPLITYNEPGNFDVTLEVSDGFDTVQIRKKDFIRVFNCYGIEDTEAFTMSIEPNPSTGRYIIKLNRQLSNQEVFFSVYNLTGYSIQNQKFLSGVQEFQIDLTGQPRGVYILEISSGGDKCTSKLIKI